MTQTKTNRTNPFFTVKREQLSRKDRTDTGYDALFRADSSEQLSVVSRDYRLVTHRSAIDFVHHMLDDLGVVRKKIRTDLARNGAKLFYEVQLPEYKFNAPDTGVKNTALDGRPGKDEFVPRLIIRNSYDKTSSFSITYGGFRFVCKNGVMIGERVHEIRVPHRGDEINFEELREPFIENIVATVDGLKNTYSRLNQEDGHPYFELVLTEELIAQKYKRLLFDQMRPYEQVQYEEDDGGRLQPIGAKQREEFTAYMLWNILTSIASHHVKSAPARFRMQRLIGRKFVG